jgi:hypothetical protein
MLFPERLFEDANIPGTDAYKFWEHAAEVAFALVLVAIALFLD